MYWQPTNERDGRMPMTRKVKTDLARRREVAKAIRSTGAELAATALVVPAIAGTLDTIRRVIAREVALMEQIQNGGDKMGLSDAKKLQALTTALSNTESMDRARQADELSALSDSELQAELDKEAT